MFTQLKKIIAVLLAVCLVVSLACVPAFATSTDTATLTGVWNFNDSLVDSSNFFNAEVGTVRDFYFSSFAVHEGELRGICFSSMEFTGNVLYYRGWLNGNDISYTVWTSADGWLSDCYKQVFFYRAVVPGGFPDWLSENASQPFSNVPISGCWQFKPYSEFDSLKPDNKFIYQEVEFWQSKTFDTAYAISFRPWYDVINQNYFVDGYNPDGSYKVGLADTGWWGEFERYRLVDFGSTPQLVSQDFYDLMTTCADPVNRSDFYPTISGEWKWNDTLPDFQSDFGYYLTCPVSVNGVLYDCAQIGSSGALREDIGVLVCLLNYETDLITPVYLEGLGWLDGSVSYSNDSVDADALLSQLVPGTQMQTWDFGTGSEQPADFVSYMTANATQPGTEPTTVTLPAGTYRFNDVLSAPSGSENVSIPITFEPVIVTLDGMEYACPTSATAIVITGLEDGVFMLHYSGVSPEDVSNYPLVYVNVEGVYWNALYQDMVENAEVDVSELQGWGQTITLPTDQEVSTEFYEWFSANAEKVAEESYTVSGKWKFHDELTAPSEKIKQNINGTGKAVYIPDGIEYIAECNSINIYTDYRVSLTYNIASTNPNNDELVGGKVVYYGATGNLFVGWNPYLSEGIRTIDFGTEPQTVSEEFYTWFVANAEAVTDDGSTDDGSGDTGGTGSGGDDSGNTGGGDTGSGGDTGDNGDSGTGGNTGGGSGSGSDTSPDYTEHHNTIIDWLQKIWQSIKDGFESVLTKLEELLGLSSGSPSENALKEATSDVVDTVTDLFYGDDSDNGSTNTGSGGSGSSSGSGGSSKVKKDDVKELSNISGRVKSWFSFDVDIGELFDAVENGSSDWFSQETANGIDSTVSVATYGRDSDPYSMRDYYEYIEYLFARFGGGKND